MGLPPEGTPPTQWGMDMLLLAATFYRTQGVLFRVLAELEKTPKPWPDNVKRARNATLIALKRNGGMWDALPQEVRQAAVGSAPN